MILKVLAFITFAAKSVSGPANAAFDANDAQILSGIGGTGMRRNFTYGSVAYPGWTVTRMVYRVSQSVGNRAY